MTDEAKILVVDDEEIVIRSCDRILKSVGIQIDKALGGKEGMRKIEEQNYDLALVDLKMPEIDGITLIKWAKTVKPAIGIVIITGYPSQETIKDALEIGIVDYVPKPFTPKVLIDVITRALDFLGKAEKKKKTDEKLPPAMADELNRIIDEFQNKPGSLIPILERTQEIAGYLPKDHLISLSERLRIPIAEIHSIVSFYNFFSMKPKGEHTVRVCLGTACYVKRAEEIVKRVTELLGIGLDDVTEDRRFSLEGVRCLGICGLAPAMVVDQDVYGMMDESKVEHVIDLYKLHKSAKES